MSAKVWIDGTLVGKNDAKVSVFDHGLLFGDGVWVGTRIYGGKAFRLAEYLKELGHAAAAYSLPLPLSADELAKAVEVTIRANNRTEGYVRLTVTRGVGTLGLDPRKCTASVVVIADDVVPYPREVCDAGLDVAAVYGPVPSPPQLLSQNVAVYAKTEALRAGCLEAVLLDPDGGVIRTTDGEVFLVAGGRLRRTTRCTGARDRVLSDAVWEVAEQAGVPTDAGLLTRDDLTAADEVFVASAAAEVVAVRSIDGATVGDGTPGPVTRVLREAYRRAVRAGG